MTGGETLSRIYAVENSGKEARAGAGASGAQPSGCFNVAHPAVFARGRPTVAGKSLLAALLRYLRYLL
jgi:hypothetical protein